MSVKPTPLSMTSKPMIEPQAESFLSLKLFWPSLIAIISIEPLGRFPIESIELQTASIIGVKYVVGALMPFTIPKILSLLIVIVSL